MTATFPNGDAFWGFVLVEYPTEAARSCLTANSSTCLMVQSGRSPNYFAALFELFAATFAVLVAGGDFFSSGTWETPPF